MAVRRQVKEEENTDINLTPMLDVTFILLIFFIVTSTFVKIPGIEIEKINTENASALKSSIIVAIDAQNHVWIDRRKLEPHEIYASIQALVEDNPGANAMIQVDAESRNKTLLDLMETMMASGMLKIDIVTNPKTP